MKYASTIENGLKHHIIDNECFGKDRRHLQSSMSAVRQNDDALQYLVGAL